MLRRHFTSGVNGINNEYYFSVSDTTRVTFSPGLLQYIKSSNTWQFAENQLEYIGAANVNGGALADKIDLFGRSGATATKPFGVTLPMSSTKAYAGKFLDYGVNVIDEYPSNTWRTLTRYEWDYLLTERNNYSNLFGVACVNDVNGLILLPDNWVSPKDVKFEVGYSDGNTNASYYSRHQTFNLNQWAELEAAGAVFLPAAGYITSKSINGDNLRGGYHTATGGVTSPYYVAVSAAST